MAKRATAGSIYRPKYRNSKGELIESKIWWLKYYQPGNPKPIRESSESVSWDEANRKLKRRLGEIVTGKFAGLAPERLRIGELLDEVLQEYVRLGRKSLYEVRLRLERHLRPAFRDVRAVNFTTTHVKSYIAVRQKQGAANATINRELSILKRAFNLAVNTDPPAVARSPYIPLLREDNVRDGFLEMDAYEALREELPEYLRLLFIVAFHVGARLGELLAIRWEQIDLAANQIRLPGRTTKNGDPRLLPIYGEMGPRLNMAKTERDLKWPECPWVFHEGGQRLLSFRKAWGAACKRANLPGLLFHDLRRSAVRNMIRAGIPEKVAMTISGHKTRAMIERYNIVSGRDLQEVGIKMEKYFASAGKVVGKVKQKPVN